MTSREPTPIIHMLSNPFNMDPRPKARKTETNKIVYDVEDCPICFDNIEIRLLWKRFEPCQHIFCYSCGDTLRKLWPVGLTCPLCRAAVHKQVFLIIGRVLRLRRNTQGNASFDSLLSYLTA